MQRSGQEAASMIGRYHAATGSGEMDEGPSKLLKGRMVSYQLMRQPVTKKTQA